MAGSYLNRDAVRAGLLVSMDFGAPNTAADKATFFMPRTVSASGNVNEDHVPFNPSHSRTFSPLVKKTVPCAIEYFDASGKLTNFGIISPSKIKITLLDTEYLLVVGFEFVVIAGQKFFYSKEEPVLGMGGIDVHQVWALAEDEG